MALQSSGTITMNDIRTELGIPTQTPFSLSNAVNGVYVPLNTCGPNVPSTTPPYELTDWYGYDHSYPCCTCTNVTIYIDQTDLDNANNNTDPSFDSKVFVDYNRCFDSVVETQSFTFNGTYVDTLCACSEGTYYMYYYFSDTPTSVSNSTFTFTTPC